MILPFVIFDVIAAGALFSIVLKQQADKKENSNEEEKEDNEYGG